MVKIRLRRVGAKKQGSFRVVVADSRSPRDGRFIEQIGFYNPRTEPETLRIDEERALYWLNVGAQPSDSAARLLTTCGTMDRFERLKQGEPLEDLLAEAEQALTAEVEEQEIEDEVEGQIRDEMEEAEAPEAGVGEGPEVEAAEPEAEEPAEPIEEVEEAEEAEEAEAEEPAVEESEPEEPESEVSEVEEDDEAA